MILSILPRPFYLRPTLEVARRLLGKILVHDSPQGRTSGRIVEAEAYLKDDPACHAVSLRKTGQGSRWATRQTRRNATMFGPPGHAYVYFSYGNHCCLNVVTQPEGVPEAVLIRAVDPLDGIPLMKKRRSVEKITLLASGPGRLTRAMGITLEHDGADLTRPPLWIAAAPEAADSGVKATPRIGIRVATGKPWRFVLASSPFLSRRAS
jgi:DNA-3-methyladenine glycosylase